MITWTSAQINALIITKAKLSRPVCQGAQASIVRNRFGYAIVFYRKGRQVVPSDRSRSLDVTSHIRNVELRRKMV